MTDEDGTDRAFRNVGTSNYDAGESLKSKNTTFRTRRKFEIKNMSAVWRVVFRLGKGKVHPCTGTEALYRPYGP